MDLDQALDDPGATCPKCQTKVLRGQAYFARKYPDGAVVVEHVSCPVRCTCDPYVDPACPVHTLP